MQRHDLSDPWEAVAGDVVEGVASQVQEPRGGRETSGHFGESTVLTRRVVRYLKVKTYIYKLKRVWAILVVSYVLRNRKEDTFAFVALFVLFSGLIFILSC